MQFSSTVDCACLWYLFHTTDPVCRNRIAFDSGSCTSMTVCCHWLGLKYLMFTMEFFSGIAGGEGKASLYGCTLGEAEKR